MKLFKRIAFVLGLIILFNLPVNAGNVNSIGTQATLTNGQMLSPGAYALNDNGLVIHSFLATLANQGAPTPFTPKVFSVQLFLAPSANGINVYSFYCPVSCFFSWTGSPFFQLFRTDVLYPTTLSWSFTCPQSATTYVMKYFNLFEDSSVSVNWGNVAMYGVAGNFLLGETPPSGVWGPIPYSLKAGDQSVFTTSGIGFILGAVGNQTCSVMIGGK